VQLDLIGDYKSNVALYPTFQELFPHPQAAVPRGVGQERSVLPAAGRRGVQARHPGAVVRFFDTGHFALETHAAEIAAAIRDFLAA
jgi:pimeloyl-ACP methyl ester carboxylesterase